MLPIKSESDYVIGINMILQTYCRMFVDLKSGCKSTSRDKLVSNTSRIPDLYAATRSENVTHCMGYKCVKRWDYTWNCIKTRMHSSRMCTRMHSSRMCTARSDRDPRRQTDMWKHYLRKFHLWAVTISKYTSKICHNSTFQDQLEKTNCKTLLK